MLVSDVKPPTRSVAVAAALATTRCFSKKLALVVLTLFADVEAGHRAVVAHHARPDFAGLALGVGQLHSGKGSLFDARKVAHGFSFGGLKTAGLPWG